MGDGASIESTPLGQQGCQQKYSYEEPSPKTLVGHRGPPAKTLWLGSGVLLQKLSGVVTEVPAKALQWGAVSKSTPLDFLHTINGEIEAQRS